MGSQNQIPPYVLRDIVETNVLTSISADVVSHIISSPPFISVPGLFNFRDLSLPHATATPLRKNYIFRSGMLHFIEDEGKVKLTTDLGVKKIFDLRSSGERGKFPPPEIEGVQVLWLPSTQDTVRFDWAWFGNADPTVAMMKMYQNILDSHAPIYRAVFEHIRDYPEEPFFFHCTAGKDRTGVLAALILRIAGYSPDIIVEDYVLTRVGFEPVRETLYHELLSKDHLDESVVKGIVVGGGIQYETMGKFLEYLEGEFENGAEGYLRSKLGFSGEDIEIIRTNLIG
ncbi:hypothetical protein AJ78_07230 [Emergomyces pasteurianus Ep9510]|uniref:Tyrosine specific protein phosphatases domain-containing protein n=1 Tax=Emergomyces pasteurianus Ep9510 TaxID=1447872 RepID=A0A1J9P7P6_9EURO|nr:hypothetical protein AJ78_07230 [Emergomyces pasteurianus Ep9510]